MPEAELLVCDCGDCLHWEVAKDFLKCKTCGVTYPLAPQHVAGFDAALTDLEVNHHKLAWKKQTV